LPECRSDGQGASYMYGEKKGAYCRAAFGCAYIHCGKAPVGWLARSDNFEHFHGLVISARDCGEKLG